MTEKEYRCELKIYLDKYKNVRARKNQLEKRLVKIQKEMDMPIGGIRYKQTPHSKTNKITDQPAGFLVRMAEIEERIAEERERESRCMLQIMEIMDYLDKDSTERRILECRYIDEERMDKIASSEHMARKTCYQYINKGIDELLKFKKVRTILEEEYRRRRLA